MGRQLLAGAIAAVGAVAGYERLAKPWMYRWGATPDEVAATLPGDDLVAPTTPKTTRAVTIEAPAEAVWPWLAQIGEDRAGFYSYDRLERLVGARIHNADSVHPEWQELRVGDTVWLARRYRSIGRQIVAAVEPGSHLVLMSDSDFRRVSEGAKASGSWAFHLQRHGASTRLLARGSAGAVGQPMFDVAHFVMERAMLLGIRNRVMAHLATGG